MRIYLLTAIALLAAAFVCLSARGPEIPFERKTIDLGVSETCAIADLPLPNVLGRCSKGVRSWRRS